MELVKEVRYLADCLARLSSEEVRSIEEQGLNPADVQRQLSSHLSDQFWCYLLRRSPFGSSPKSLSKRKGRFSASGILEDVDRSVRKKALHDVAHGHVSFDSTAPTTPYSTSLPNKDKIRPIYQRREIYVEVALSLHRQVMRRKDLNLELLAFDILLELYGSISHLPRLEDNQSIVSSSENSWYPFTCAEEVLEMLCHLSSEPVSCIAALVLGRYVLIRKGIKDIRSLDIKDLLGLLDDPGLKLDEAHKWITASTGSSVSRDSSQRVSDFWPSAAFDRALSRISNINPTTKNFDSASTGLRTLPLNPLLGFGVNRLEINPAWKSISSQQSLDSFDKRLLLPLPKTSTMENNNGSNMDSHLSEKWLSSSLQLQSLEDDKSESSAELLRNRRLVNSGMLLDTPVETVSSTDWMKDRVNLGISGSSSFCHVDEGSSAIVQNYKTWQSLPSFDTAELYSQVRSGTSAPLSRQSIIEAMTEFTVSRLQRGVFLGNSADDKCSSDWYRYVLMCLQGLESQYFVSKASSTYNKEPLLFPAKYHQFFAPGLDFHRHTSKTICKALFADFMASAPGDRYGAEPAWLSFGGRALGIHRDIVPSEESVLSHFLQLEATQELKDIPGYSAVSNIMSDIANVGSTVRSLKYFVELIRRIESLDDFRDRIGTVISVYTSTLSCFLNSFQSAVSNLGETDYQGNLRETLSVFSLFFTRLYPWLQVIVWYARINHDDAFHSITCVHYRLPRGSYFLDHVIVHYLGTFGSWIPENSLSRSYAYRCLVTIMKPYLWYLRRWITGVGNRERVMSEFERNGRLHIIFPLLPLAHVIASSRELCSIMERYYHMHLPSSTSVFSDYLDVVNSDALRLLGTTDEPMGDVPPFADFIQALSEEIHANFTHLNRKVLSLFKSEYRFMDIMDDINRFVFLTRLDVMDGIFEEWSRDRGTDAYKQLFSPPLIVEDIVDRSATFKFRGPSLRFFAGAFDRYIFTEVGYICIC
ncbi:uncharacterized protein BXIN_1580 [Babesia sp. Xinjiang]|uniref:uncharacterized protein n=1 Tax=Babesia sp. Xinjiang TaxID=462227 RepID=UPI000A24A1A2|nr:uncharacterized protein BXIN_1580 [Babesia sp. Xinjiang]ORM42380.1 hypothetical protein BXIN_1580 [Babesia sp. Xinjiang]